MKQSKFPPGWDAARVQRVLVHYEQQSEEQAVAEDEAAAAALVRGTCPARTDHDLSRKTMRCATPGTPFPPGYR